MQAVLESYRVGADLARRYWALPGRILVGGHILDPADALHLQRVFGVTHVLSAELESTDDASWGTTNAARFPFPDNGFAPQLGTVQGAVRYARRVLADPRTVLYTHCRLGGSRGPSYAYLALRVLGLPPDVALLRAGVRQDGQALHPAYITTIEQALASA